MQKIIGFMMSTDRQARYERWFYVLLALWGIVYCGLTLTPSSYALTLNALNGPDAKVEYTPLASSPKPIRSDEYTLLTPYFQIAVNNHFQRYNESSPYKEDLRDYIVLPLWDWGLIFKPAAWLFHLAPPAFAYSFYYFFYAALFLVGYYHLLRRLQLPFAYALSASFLFYLCAFTQHWYALVIGHLAWFPWILLAWVYRGSLWLRFAMLGYAATAFLLSALYVPGALPLAYAALWILMLFFPYSMRPLPLISGGLAALLALVLFVSYDYDTLSAMSETLYPGQRRVSGGTLEPAILLGLIFPSLTTIDADHIIGTNICEISTLGSYLLLVMAFFTKEPAQLWRALMEDRRARWLLAAMLPLLAWMVLPVPAGVGHWLLLDRLFPERWLFALGLLLHLSLLTVFSRLSYEVTPKRLTLFAACVLAASFLAKTFWVNHKVSYILFIFAFADYAIVLLLWMTITFFPRLRTSTLLLLLAVTLSNTLAYGMFNPWQSAKPIFSPPQTPYFTALKNDPQNYMASGEYIGPVLQLGATLNGLGLNSLIHVQMAPKFDFFHRLFGECLSEDDFNQIFNRYAHIILYDAQPGDPYYEWAKSKRTFQVYECATGGKRWEIYGISRDKTRWLPGEKTNDVVFLPRAFFRARGAL